MCPINPYQSPETAGSTRPVAPRPVYRSRKHALLAGLWRGTKFGGKLSAAVFSTLILLLWITCVIAFLYAWLVRGDNPLRMLEKAESELLPFIGMSIVAVVMPTILGTATGAAIMGFGTLLTYRAADASQESLSSDAAPPQDVDQAADGSEVF